MASLAAVAFGVLFLALAAVAGWYGWRQRTRHALVTGTETTDVRDIREEGLVELEGEVSGGETFQSPIRAEESVLAGWEIEEWEEHGDSSSWRTQATGVYARPFSLEDGTGEVQIEVGEHVQGEGDMGFDVNLGRFDVDRWLSRGVSAEDVYCSFERFPVETTVPPDRDPPERIAEFVRGESGVSRQTGSITNVVDLGNKHGERRYYEETIEPGQEIYLLGEATATPDATRPLKPEDVVIRPPEGDDEVMIVSDQSEEALAEELGRYRWAFAAAAVLGVLGIGLLVYGAGVI